MGYIDPGAFGLISQIGYVILFALATGFMFFFNPIKRGLKRLLRRGNTQAQSPNDEAPKT